MSILKVNQITPYTGSTLIVSGSTLSIPGGTVSGTSLTGTLTTAAQPNVTSLGTLTQLNTDNIRIDGNTISSTDTNGNVLIQPNGTGDVVINESGADVDFRVEGDTEQNLLFVDASTDRVGIGTNTPNYKLQVFGNGSFEGTGLRLNDTQAYNFGTSGPGLSFTGLDSSSVLTLFGTIRGTPQNGNPDRGYLNISTRVDGVNTQTLQIGTGLSADVIVNTGNVGIGTTTITGNAATSGLLHINGGSSNAELHLTNTTTGTTGSDGGIILQYGSQLVIANLENDAMLFLTNNQERMRILAGGGLTFNGDTAAANALDDYEEGTYTPTFVNVTLGNATSEFKYVKIGKQLTVSGYIIFGSTTSFGGTIQIGMPLTIDTSVNGTAYLYDDTGVEYLVSAGTYTGSYTRVLFSDGTGGGFVSNTSPFTWAVSDRFAFTVTYFTT